MGIGGGATAFILWPLSFRAVRLVCKRCGGSVCGHNVAGWDHLPLFPCGCQTRVRARGSLARTRLLRPQGALRSYRIGVVARLLGVCWRRPLDDGPAQTRTALTSILAFIVWWGFLSGHV